MKVISFDKTELSNLSFSNSKEFLETNTLGACSSATIVNLNTRRYHGLLSVRQPKLGPDNYVLLSYLEETVVFHEEVYQLGTHQYPGVIEPKGYLKLLEFSLAKIPTWRYEFGGGVLKKELLLASKSNQVLMRYTLEKGAEIKLSLDPFGAFRRSHDLGKERCFEAGVNLLKFGVQFKMDEHLEALNIQMSQANLFKEEPFWFYNNQYLVEKERGYEFEEDLYRPGSFHLDLQEGQSIVVSAATEPVEPELLEKQFTQELATKPILNSFDSILNRAAEQFIAKTKRGVEICAGFHWFGRWGRDTFIALPGLTLARGKIALCEQIIDTMLQDLKEGLFTNVGVGNTKEYNSVDASLWFFWTLCELAEYKKSQAELWEKYGSEMKQILRAYKNGTLYNIKMQEDGLLYAGQEGLALTWMDAKVEGKPVTQRRGKPVEINALWYNAIAFSLTLAKSCKEELFIQEWEPIKAVIEKSFVANFWNSERGYLADVVNHKTKDWSIRPNQLFAISVPYPILKGERAKKVLSKVQQELYTPYGLRTLSPADPNYKHRYHGSQIARDYCYHQGIIWPWLLGAYCEASFKLKGVSFLKEMQKINDNFAQEFNRNGLGSVSELYHDRNDPQGVGAIAQAWSVSELIRANKLLKNHLKKVKK